MALAALHVEALPRSAVLKALPDEGASGKRVSGSAADGTLRGLVGALLPRRQPVAADGAAVIAEGRSKPGDHVDLRAEMDLLVVISNCPERDNPAAGGSPTPIRAVVYTPA